MTVEATWPFGLSLVAFAVATLTIGLAGARLTRLADRLADATGLGEAITGALLLGATTSLPGVVTSVTTALQGHAAFAISHAVGGIGLQTAFLAVADLTYRRANLEHAAASQANMGQATLLIGLLSLLLLGIHGPDVTVWAVHPTTLLLVVAYLFGLRIVRRMQTEPLWTPARTASTRLDTPSPGEKRAGLGVWTAYAGLAVLVGAAGWILARSAVSIAAHTGLSHTLMGGVFTTFSTSLPELVTTLAAVRQGALTLAVGGIIGGNTFDVLLTAASDVAYRDGSIYHAVGRQEVVLVSLALLLTAIVLLGLLRREERGIANIGFESFLVLVVYGGGVLLLVH